MGLVTAICRFLVIAALIALGTPVLAQSTSSDRSAISLAKTSPDGSIAGGKRLALVIGNAGYSTIPELANPEADANLISQTLEAVGFTVTKLIDASQAEMKRGLLEFGRALRQDGVEAGLFYYAGHGVQVRGENYLVPVNAVIADEDEVDIEAVNVHDFLQVMNSSKSRINIVILDACRNNPYARGFRSITRGLAPVDAPTGTFIAYSTAPGQVALDGETLGNSPYTAALVEAISTPGRSIESVFKETRRLVLDKTGRKQVPWETSSIVGDFYFTPDAGSGGANLGRASRAWEVVRNSSDPAELELFIETFGAENPFLQALAERKLETLQSEVDMAAIDPAEQAGGSAVASASQGPVKMAVAGPLTGTYAFFGDQIKNGAEAAVRDINAAGGLNGATITLREADDLCEPQKGSDVANQLVDAGTTFVVGHFCSGASIPASDVYAAGNVVMVSPASSNPLLTERGLWNTFRVAARDDRQSSFIANFIARRFSEKKVAIIQDGSVYGKALTDDVKSVLNASGINEAMTGSIESGQKDFTSLVHELAANEIEVLVFGGYHAEAGLLVRQIQENGQSIQFIGGDALVTDEFGAIAGDAGEGAMMSFLRDPRNRSSARATVDDLTSRGLNAEGYTLYAYAAAQVIAIAAERAGSNDPRKVAAEISSGRPFETVLGTLNFDPNGDRIQDDYTMYVWRRDGSGGLYYEEMN